MTEETIVWFSVDERTPEPDTECLMQFANGNVARGDYMCGGFWLADWGSVNNVVAWAAMPQGPARSNRHGHPLGLA
jgi:hypothetical protein